MNTFETLGLSERTLKAIQKKGFEEPTEIQSRCIPVAIQKDCDILGQAQTGTGKTAAFGLPLLDMVNHSSNQVQALILTPTRELAIQVAEEISSCKGESPLHVAAIYGGQSIGLQIGQLRRGAQIVVGTPGRVIDHIQRKTLKTHSIGYLVLDEADEMLNMGFIDEIETILEQLPEERKTMLFSATLPRQIQRLAEKYMRTYEKITVEQKNITSSLTEQIYIEVEEFEKLEALRRVIEMEEEFYGLIFCRTKNGCDEVAKRLTNSGLAADALHGDLSQAQREKVLNRFREKQLDMVVATDVAARGIDIQNLTHVINYSLPQNPESYVHRVGRTGRAGNQGTAITFVTPSEYRKIQYIQRATQSEISRKQLPNVEQLIAIKKERILQEIEDAVEPEKKDEFDTTALLLQEQYDASDIIAGLLRSQYASQLDKSNYHEIGRKRPNIQKSTRLFVAKGKKHNMIKRSLVTYLSEISGVPGNRIQGVQIMQDFSFVSVSLRDAETIIRSFKRKKPGKRAVVTKAKAKKY